MARPRVYGDEFRERAVRLLREWREARGVTEGGYTAVAEQSGHAARSSWRRARSSRVRRGRGNATWIGTFGTVLPPSKWWRSWSQKRAAHTRRRFRGCP
jgi:hypothetical protein